MNQSSISLFVTCFVYLFLKMSIAHSSVKVYVPIVIAKFCVFRMSYFDQRWFIDNYMELIAISFSWLSIIMSLPIFMVEFHLHFHLFISFLFSRIIFCVFVLKFLIILINWLSHILTIIFNKIAHVLRIL